MDGAARQELKETKINPVQRLRRKSLVRTPRQRMTAADPLRCQNINVSYQNVKTQKQQLLNEVH